MSKRPVDDIEDGNQAYLKRQKISNNPTFTPAPATDEIRSARKLRQILAFDQDSGRSKHGGSISRGNSLSNTDQATAVQIFKTFLDSFSNEEPPNPGRLSILKEYLESQKLSDEDDKDHIYLGELIKTWSLASQSNDDSLLSAVPAVLALLLKTISTILELSEYGLRLGRTLLQKPQLELIARGLNANKTREFVISPALRLLRELVIFDGGRLAKQIFRAREHTFRSLVRNLNLRYTGDGVEDRRKPSVRTNALRFVLSILKFLPSDAKRDLLNQRDLVSALTWEIKDNPPFMVREILEVLKLSVLQDEALPRDSKTQIVNNTSLERIATLYRYDHADEELSMWKKSVNTEAHEFLVLACTSPDLGVLTRQAGLYPRGIDPDDTHIVDSEQSFIDLGMDSIEWMDSFTEEVPVRNTILSGFMQSLRPWSSTKQSELILSIFKSAPELIGDYFLRKKSFYFDPKLSTTWMGYAAFVFSSIQLPVPKYFGHQGGYARLPPPMSIVLNNILPEALDQKVLTRCLGQSLILVTFFTIRLLCVALTKLRTVLKMYQEASEDASSIWIQAAERLTAEFCQKCPSIKLIISSFKKMANRDLMQREAATRLIVLYYEVIPRVALDAKFDVSATLAEVLLTMDETTQTSEERTLRAMELENIFQWAHFSPGMRWFSPAEGLTISPMIIMLKLCAEAPPDIPLVKLRSVLESVVLENQILQTSTTISALGCLILRLREAQGPNAGAVYAFIDDCISRCTSKSVKYIFSLEEVQAEAHQSIGKQAPVSLLTLAISEQWPFIVKSSSPDMLKEISEFVASYLAGSTKIKEDKKVLKILTKRIASATPKDTPAYKIIESSRRLVDTVIVPEPKHIVEPIEHDQKSNIPSEFAKGKILESMMEHSDIETEDHGALVKWTTKEVDEVIEAGHAAALVRLLSSEHLSVRKEAATNLSKFSARLKESNFEEKEQIWLLFAEVVETAKKVVDKEPLPTLISSFAAHAISVLNDPLHCLYPKINKFLSQGPIWELDKVPLMYKILDEAPSLDDAHYLETAWLLNYMLGGLRTMADMSIFRKRRVFEKLFSLYNNTYLAPGLRDKILKILFRASTIEGGSTTLITRFSTVTWLEAQVALGGGVPLKVLMEKIMESCDEKRVGIWSMHGARRAHVDTVKF
jgi:nucleolar pre-ribosomal-associated protein 1